MLSACLVVDVAAKFSLKSLPLALVSPGSRQRVFYGTLAPQGSISGPLGLFSGGPPGGEKCLGGLRAPFGAKKSTTASPEAANMQPQIKK